MPTPARHIAHINLAHSLRGGERQTLLLIAALAERGWKQRLIARPGAPLAPALIAEMDGTVPVRVASNIAAAALAVGSAALIHAHDGRAVYGAALAAWQHGCPYIITRRVMNPIRQRWASRQAYRRAAAVVAISSAVAAEIRRFDRAIEPVRIPSAYQPAPVVTGMDQALRTRWQQRFVVGQRGRPGK